MSTFINKKNKLRSGDKEIVGDEADNNSKYLGLPSILGRNKTVIFGYLKDKIKASIQGWSEQNVSKPAKEILIKMVTQALPSFAMSVFLLPMELIREIESCMSKFFWKSSQKSNSSISWMAWNRMVKHKHAGGLGFRSLRDFNIAMLGKQCWRLLTNQESLVARIYKSRYYADSNFLEAKLGNSPSFIWRSVLEARSVISAASSWRIGAGNDISILNQPWLSDEENPYVTTVSQSLVNQKVAALFRIDAKEWDKDIIVDIFEERDQNCIFNTVIEQELHQDVLCWRLEHSGNYTVKSAYRFIQQLKGAWDVIDNIVWKMVWNIKAPPKILNLIWRAVSYCLPTKVQLQIKHVPVDNICPMCNKEVESIYHALVQCSTASQCWHIFNSNIVTNGNMDFSEWLEQTLAVQTTRDRAKVITLCWSIWRARNDLVWNNRRWSVMKIVAKAWEYLSQWTSTQSRYCGVPIQPPVTGDGAILWVKPHHNTVKITADAAIAEDLGKTGVGLIARNHDGDLLQAKSRSYAEVMNPTLAEAIAIKEALSWAKEMQQHIVTVESDCLVAVQMIRSEVPMRSRIGQVIAECRELVCHNNNVKLYFIKRSANMPAHELAHVAHMYPDRSFDWSSVPVKVKQCIQYDLLN